MKGRRWGILEVSTTAQVRRLLLVSGIFASVLTYATDLIAGTMRPAYNFARQSASVLSAPDAPTRAVVLPLDLLADGLVVACGVGVWLSAGRRRSLRAIGGLLVASAVLQAVAVAFFPFRPAQPASRMANKLNVAFMAPSIVGWFLIVVLGAMPFRNWFRFFSVGLLAVWLVEDVLATAGASLFVAGGQSGSMVGLQERSMAYGFYAWLALLACVCLRASGLSVTSPQFAPPSPSASPRRLKKIWERPLSVR
jgi:hypothetical protein